ncbi:MAG: hypothetical protein AAF125_09415 [Chloroflexota bacterium]
MCIFCAAVPAAAALGAKASVDQRAARAEQSETDTPTAAAKPSFAVNAGGATAVVIAGLMTASVIYHTQIGPV